MHVSAKNMFLLSVSRAYEDSMPTLYLEHQHRLCVQICCEYNFSSLSRTGMGLYFYGLLGQIWGFVQTHTDIHSSLGDGCLSGCLQVSSGWWSPFHPCNILQVMDMCRRGWVHDSLSWIWVCLNPWVQQAEFNNYRQMQEDGNINQFNVSSRREECNVSSRRE